MRLITAFLLWLLAISLSALASAQPNGPYEILDSGFPAEDFWPTAWIDNNRILFTGVKLTERCNSAAPSCGARGLQNATYIWDIRNNHVSLHHDSIFYQLCVHAGYISYKAHERLTDKKVTLFAGEFGREKKRSLPDKQWFNPISCKYFDRPPEWAERRAAGRNITPLLEEHGYIDFGPIDFVKRSAAEKADTRAVLRTPDQKQFPVSFDGERWFGPIGFSYVSFSNEYFINNFFGDVSVLRPAFYMAPDGKLRKMEFNVNRRLGGRYYAVRPGVFVVTGGEDLRGTNAGGYVANPSQIARVIAGDLRSTSVSPDGCNVAFTFATSQQARSEGYAEWKRGRPANTLRMVKLCAR